MNDKTHNLAKQAYFEDLQKIQKYMPRVVFDDKIKTGHRFEIMVPLHHYWPLFLCFALVLYTYRHAQSAP